MALPGGVTSLDVTIRDVYAEEVFALLRRFNTEHGTTVLFVTHNVALSERCDRTIEVIDGQVTGE